MSGVSAGPRDVRRLPYGGAIFRARTHAVANRSEVAIDTLTSSQRARLKALAHPLKPILHIGREGVTPHALDAVRQAFNTREILKVKVLDTAPA